MTINGGEVAYHYTEYAIRNASTGAVLDGYDSQQAAEFDAILYPASAVVQREVYVTDWKQSGELSVTVAAD